MKYVIKLVSKNNNMFNNQYFKKSGGFTKCRYDEALSFSDFYQAKLKLKEYNKNPIKYNSNYRYVLEEIEE